MPVTEDRHPPRRRQETNGYVAAPATVPEGRPQLTREEAAEHTCEACLTGDDGWRPRC